MKSKKNYLNHIRLYKLVLLIITSAIACTSFLILYLNHDFREFVYSDKRLLILCALLWITLLTEFTHTLLDLLSLKRLAQTDHDLNRLAYLDHLTGIPNRYSCDLIFSQFNTPDKISDIGCILMAISNLGEINETQTHEIGDHIISDFCTILESVGNEYGFVGRNSGNEFLLVIDHCTNAKTISFLDSFTLRLQNYNILNPEFPIHIRYACLLNQGAHAAHFFEFITQTYALFHEKSLDLI